MFELNFIPLAELLQVVIAHLLQKLIDNGSRPQTKWQKLLESCDAKQRVGRWRWDDEEREGQVEEAGVSP